MVGNTDRVFCSHAIENLIAQCALKGLSPGFHVFVLFFYGKLLRQAKDWINAAVIMNELTKKRIIDADMYRLLAVLRFLLTYGFFIERDLYFFGLEGIFEIFPCST